MKSILMNISEMSDSREVYESKPNPIIAIFLYTILGIVVVAFIWMYFGKIDVVVKSEAILRPNDQVATVINTYAGTLEIVNIEDGSFVQEGDVLYIIEHEDLQTELSYYNEQLVDTEKTLKMLKKYKQSIEDGVNYFEDIPEEEEYYIKVKSYLTNYKMTKNNLNYDKKERKMNLSSITKQLQNLNQKLKYTQQLKLAINANKNMFTSQGTELEYYNKFLKYQSDYAALNQKYLNAKSEIEHSVTEEGLVSSLDYYNEILKGLKTLKSSIKKNQNLFNSESSYSLQYEEYINKVADLTTTYEQAKENYEINKALEGLEVSEWDVQQSKVAMEEASRAIDSYKASFMNNITSNIAEVEKKIEEATLNKENTISKDKLLKQNEKERIAALENFKLQYIVELDNTINTLKENISNLEANKKNIELQSEKKVVDEDGIDGNLSEYQNSELATTITSINTYENKKMELETNIDKIKSQIDSAIVKATKSGSINSNIELVEGNVLQSGIEVLNIIPSRDSKYKANIYVSNRDIGKLKQGMKVKLNVYALPNSNLMI